MWTPHEVDAADPRLTQIIGPPPSPNRAAVEVLRQAPLTRR